MRSDLWICQFSLLTGADTWNLVDRLAGCIHNSCLLVSTFAGRKCSEYPRKWKNQGNNWSDNSQNYLPSRPGCRRLRFITGPSLSYAAVCSELSFGSGSEMFFFDRSDLRRYILSEITELTVREGCPWPPERLQLLNPCADIRYIRPTGADTHGINVKEMKRRLICGTIQQA